MKHIADADIARCRNLLGKPLSGHMKWRLRQVVLNPTPDTWDRAHGVLVAPTRTLWQSVIRINPRIVAVADTEATPEQRWPEVPTSHEIIQAMRLAAEEGGAA